MTRADLDAQIAAFFAKGGEVKPIPEGKTSDPYLRECRCGCRGNYTEHSMRAGESGRSSSIVIR